MKAVVFDLDGTLIHSVPDLHVAVSRLLDEEGQPPLSIETVQGFVGNGLPRLVELVIETAGLDMTRQDEFTTRAQALYKEENGRLTRCYPGVEACLADLAARGLLMGVCTNKPEPAARDILDHLGLLSYFPIVVGGDTLPERKPHARPLLATLEALGTTVSHTVFVGDSEVDAATAAAANVRFALYTEGYRKSPVSALAHDVAFDDFQQFPTVLDSLN